MSGAESAPATHGRAHEGTRWVALLVGAAALIGVGLLGTAYWLITFSWLDFLSLIAVVVGAILLFTRASGPDRA